MCRVFLEFCSFGIWLITPCKNFLPQVKIPWDSLCCSFAPPEMLYFYLLQRTAFCRSVVEVSGELIGNVTVQCHQGTSSSESMSSEEVRNWFLLLGECKILLILFQGEVRYISVKVGFTTGSDPLKLWMAIQGFLCIISLHGVPILLVEKPRHKGTWILLMIHHIAMPHLFHPIWSVFSVHCHVARGLVVAHGMVSFFCPYSDF